MRKEGKLLSLKLQNFKMKKLQTQDKKKIVKSNSLTSNQIKKSHSLNGYSQLIKFNGQNHKQDRLAEKLNKSASNSKYNLNRKQSKIIELKGLKSSSSSKQLRQDIHAKTQKKSSNYIFNGIKCLKAKNQLKITSINDKSIKKQSHKSNKQNFIFNKTSKSDFAKIKKKKTQISKQLNNFNKTLSTAYYTKTTNFNQTQTHLNTTYLQEKKNLSKTILSEINVTLNQLKTQLNYQQLKKLEFIRKAYQKIILQIRKPSTNQQVNQQLATCQLSLISTQRKPILLKYIGMKSTAVQTQGHSLIHPNDLLNVKLDNSQQQYNSQSQHWDSYLDNSVPSRQDTHQNNKQSKVAFSLNLNKIKKQQILQYHKEFMQNQEFFSQSWKRQLNKQKKF